MDWGCRGKGCYEVRQGRDVERASLYRGCSWAWRSPACSLGRHLGDAGEGPSRSSMLTCLIVVSLRLGHAVDEIDCC